MTHVRYLRVTAPGGALAATQTFTGDTEFSSDESIAASAELRISIAVPTATIKSFVILTDQPLTVCNGDIKAGTPDDQFSLAANVAYAWAPNDPGNAPFSVDIHDIYITNEGTDTATVKLRFLLDATP